MDKHHTHGYYTVHISKKKGGYLVEVPALPGCLTQGRTYDEAVKNADEAIEAYLGVLVKIGKPIPVEKLKPSKVHIANVRLPIAV